MIVRAGLDALLVDGAIPMVIGDRVDSQPRSEGIAIWNPSRGEVLCRVQTGDRQDVEEAVRVARNPTERGIWPGSARSRARLMTKLAELIERDAEILGSLDSLSVGLTMRRARDEVAAIVEDLEYFAGWCTKLEGTLIPVSDASTMAMTLPRPIGVCVAITSWNWPMEGFMAKLAPAIAAGNSVIVKPSEQATPSVIWLARLALEAGFPPGIINAIPGDGPGLGMALVGHPQVDAVSFTGSTAVGEIIASKARAGRKRISLQLSGTCYALVFDDADLEAAAKRLVSAAFDHNGQNCIAPSRVFVQSRSLPALIEAMARAMDRFIVGDPFALQADAGPMISLDSRSRVSSLLESAVVKGAAVVIRGRLDPSALDNGFYLAPQMVMNVPSDHSLMKGEVFGPIIILSSFENEAMALDIARGYTSALAAGVWTNDVSRAHRLARSLQAGTVWVNGYGVYDSAMPVGGWGHGGLGRELGREALEFYLQRRSIWFVG